VHATLGSSFFKARRLRPTDGSREACSRTHAT